MTRRQIRPPGIHVVAQGEDVPMIAWTYGFRDWTIVWDHAQNQAFREAHASPKVLCPGAELFIPENTDGRFDLPVEQVHRVELDPPKTSLNVRILISGRPVANREYTFSYAYGPTTRVFEGRHTDGDGWLREANIPMVVTHVTALFTGSMLYYRFALRALDPVRVDGVPRIQGVQARLNNLGFFCGDVDGLLAGKTIEAVRQFQAMKLERAEPSGELDDETLDTLVEEHGA